MSRALRSGRALPILAALVLGCACRPDALGAQRDPVRRIQLAGVEHGEATIAHFGPDRDKWVSWHDHTNRLIPVWTYGTRGRSGGVDLEAYTGSHSLYRDETALRELYGGAPAATLAPNADYMDQTQLATLQRAALAAGIRRIVVFVFDGMDYETARAAAVVRAGGVRYTEGRGSGLQFEDYTAGGTTQFTSMVTSPIHDHARTDVDAQTVEVPSGGPAGGYDPVRGGAAPWSAGTDPLYATGQAQHGSVRHAVADSAATATAMFSGTKTYNGAINVDPTGRKLSTVAHEAQQRGLAVGVVTSVPFSHATPAAAYAHNVSRADYQDLARDLLGLASVSHPDRPLRGMNVVIGCGHGVERSQDATQGRNFVSGNRYVTEEDLSRVDAERGGRYVVARRRAGQKGGKALAAAAGRAAKTGLRLLGLYGVEGGHLPYRTANGDYRPVRGADVLAETYTGADLEENPTLPEMTAAALTVLETNPRGFWLMVEPGDVDWANHDANLDDSIGAVLDGDDAVRVVTDWIESHGGWNEALLIVTADHAHYLVLENPAALVTPPR